MHSSSSGQYNTLHDIMVAIPYVSLTHRLARRLRLSSALPIEQPEEFYYQGDFRLYPKQMQDMELDNSVMGCIPDSSKLDNVIGNDSLILSAIKMMLKKGLMRQQELVRALLPVFLEQMMTPPNMKQLCFYNRMMKLPDKIQKR